MQQFSIVSKAVLLERHGNLLGAVYCCSHPTISAFLLLLRLLLLSQEAVALVQGIPDAQRAVRRLVEESYMRGSMDNISAVLIKLKF